MMRRDKQNDNPLKMKYLEAELGRNVSGTRLAVRRDLFLRTKIITLAKQGHSTKQIALQLNIDQQTVISYRTLIRTAKDRSRLIAAQFSTRQSIDSTDRTDLTRPPVNAEYVLHLLLRKDERDVLIGDLIEDYGTLVERFNKRRADIWFYKQVAGSLLPLLRRALLRIGALVWVSQILRRWIA